MIIGGTGHIGSFLVPQLVDEGHEVLVVSTGRRAADFGERSDSVKPETLNYAAMLADGSFRELLERERPAAVVDILQQDSHGILSACKGTSVDRIVFCGSIWMYGRPKVVPTPEVRQTECPFEGYEVRYNQMLDVLKIASGGPVSVSAVMPPNICGPGKIPLEGSGGRSLDVHRAHQRGEEVVLPYPGTNLIGPCDAEDVARSFACALGNRDAAAGEVFNVGSAYALTSEQFINTYAAIYGTRIPIRYVEPREYETVVQPNPGASFHFMEHMCPDISKISSRLGYAPAHTPEASMERAVRWMRDQGMV